MRSAKVRKAEQPSEIAQALRSVLPADAVLDRPWELEVYGYDATLLHERPEVVVLPTSTEEVAAAVNACRRAGVVITPRGCATSLSGGPVPWQGGAVVSLTRMNRIVEIDTAQRRAVVQPGVINAELNTAARKVGLAYVPDPASQTACSIGGNVAENAGGPHCLKYGVTANHILGLTVVTAEGEVLRLGGKEVVARGLDLRGVMVGSEGTLGIVTEIVCKLLPAPPAIETMLACFASIEDAGEAVSGIIAEGLVPATLEMVDRMVIDAVAGYAELGYPRDVAAVLVIEIDGLAEALAPQVERIEAVCTKHRALRFERAETEADRERLWRGRKGATAALSRLAPAKVSSDIAVPRRRLAEALHEMAEISRRFDIPIANVFHAGDGNLHPQILFDPRDAAETKRAMDADDAVTELALRYGGVLTGEHGIGIEKRKWMTAAYSADELRAMWMVKDAFDAGGVMNPGKVLPPKEEIGEMGAPESVWELAEVVREAEARGLKVNVGEQSRMAGEGAVEIDLAALDGIVSYDPESLTVKVGAAMTVGALRVALAEHRQMVGPWRWAEDGLSAGMLAATASPTPGMTMYGAARDVVVGLRVVTAGGHDLRLGSSCVKNSSGYALERLFVGAHASLGIIGEVSLRTHPVPEAERRLTLAADGQALERLVRSLLGSPAPIEYARAWPAEGGAWRIEIGVCGWEAEVDAAARLILRMAADAGAKEDEALSVEPSARGTWVCYEPMAAARKACEPAADVTEYWPMAGIVFRPGLPSSAEDLYAGGGPEIAIARRVKGLMDPQSVLPPWK